MRVKSRSAAIARNAVRALEALPSLGRKLSQDSQVVPTLGRDRVNTFSMKWHQWFLNLGDLDPRGSIVDSADDFSTYYAANAGQALESTLLGEVATDSASLTDPSTIEDIDGWLGWLESMY